MAERAASGPPVVGIGASAGGVTALGHLLGLLPADPGVALVVVMHLVPEHESHLARLLGERCRLPVEEVRSDTVLQADRVYVIPPDANLETVDSHLRLGELEPRRRDRAPIDHFFTTLAAAQGAGAVGVVLTGTGSDGTAGLRRIKEAGGVTLAQDPAEAEHDGMPSSAIAAGVVDQVLRLDEIPGALQRLAADRERTPGPPAEAAVAGDEERLLQEIFSDVESRTGIDLGMYERPLVMRRLELRMHVQRVSTPAGYLEALRREAAEAWELISQAPVSRARFFSPPATYDVLGRRVVPVLLADKGHQDHLRAWSVGCASGEEAYSLAILLAEGAAAAGVRPEIRVFATDLTDRALATARRGVYPRDIEREVSAERLRRFFVDVDEGGGYRVRPELRQLMIFARHDLLGDPPFAHLDLIVCRGVLRSLGESAQRELVRVFHRVLEPGGTLVLGATEALDEAELFVCEDSAAPLYRRSDTETPRRRSPAPGPGWSRPRPPAAFAAPPAPSTSERSPAFGELHERMIERYAPASLLLDAEDRVVHASPRAGRYLVLPGGEPTRELCAVVPEPLRSELRATLFAARADGREARTRPVDLHLEGAPVRVAVRVLPAAAEELAGFALAVFEELGAAPPAAEGGGAAAGEHGVGVQELERDLAEARRQLERLGRGHEASRDAMRAANQELLSANEELRITNSELRSALEELESTREELAMANEELEVVGEERRQRTEELHRAVSDLQNLLSSTDIATVFLDSGLGVVSFTPRAREIFRLRPGDRGRPLTDLAPRLRYPGLEADARRVLESLEPVEQEVEGDDDGWFLARLHPYRDTEDRVGGVVLTLVDISSRRRAEEALERARDELEERVEERTAELRELSERLRRMAGALGSAEQEERRRLAALLHDELQQYLVAARMHLERGAEAGAEDALAAIQSSIACCRDLSRRLRPPALYEAGLVPALGWLAEEMGRLQRLEVRFTAPEEPPQLSNEAAALLFSSVQELLLNVVKHADTGACYLRVLMPDDRLVIEVEDRGRGFAGGAAEAGNGETGLGLFSIRERLRALGGELSVHSAPGKGTLVRLTAPPAAVVGEPAPLHPETRFREATITVARVEGRTRVLIADDHALVRQGIADLLERDQRLEVVGQAGDGEQVLEMVGACHPNVVIMDVNMPGINGIEATRELRRRWGDVRVIGLSVQSDAATAEAMRRAGAEQYLAKSEPSERLIAAILSPPSPEEPAAGDDARAAEQG